MTLVIWSGWVVLGLCLKCISFDVLYVNCFVALCDLRLVCIAC